MRLLVRAVTSDDGMTADFYHYDMEFLGRAATRIINEVLGINPMVYHVTSKPPGTIERAGRGQSAALSIYPPFQAISAV